VRGWVEAGRGYFKKGIPLFPLPREVFLFKGLGWGGVFSIFWFQSLFTFPVAVEINIVMQILIKIALRLKILHA